MAITAHERIVKLLDRHNVRYEQYHHAPCASSEESARVRAAAGAGHTVGAKAMLLRTRDERYVLCVLPGHARLDSRRVRKLIGKHSFATSDEMYLITSGLQPGHMPPFGGQLFADITTMIVDPEVLLLPRIGFNAADPTESIVMSGDDYRQTVQDGCLIETISTKQVGYVDSNS